MLRMRTDFGPFVRWKEQILRNKLHHEGHSEVLAMLQYGEGYTDKSIVYLLHDEDLVGYCYIEHFRSQGKPHKGTFGIFLQPEYRRFGHSYKLAEALKDVVKESGWYGVIVEVDPKALKIFQRAFGENYPIQLLS